jgi:hypothetical protein
MCTMTTVGYGDMPTLTQEMRIFTLFFGLIGVVVSAVCERALSSASSPALPRCRSPQTLPSPTPAFPPPLMAMWHMPTRIPAAACRHTHTHRPTLCSCAQVVAGSITVIADWFSQQGRKKFMAKQRVLLREAAEVAAGVRHIVRERGEDPMAPAAADPELELSPAQAGTMAVGSGSATGMAGADGEGTAAATPAGRGLLAAWSRCLPGPKRRKFIFQVLKALRLTGCFFVLCILMGEIENAHVADCGFGSGWTCGGTTSCDQWKLGTLPTDPGGVDRGFCWTWIDELYYATMT